jgi:hypothetical protein
LTRRSSADTRPRSSGYENGLLIASHSLSALFGPIRVRTVPDREREPLCNVARDGY